MARKQLLSIAIAGMSATIIDRLLLQTGGIAFAGIVLYLLTAGAYTGALLLPKERLPAQTFWGSTTLLSCILLINTAIYYAFGTRVFLSWIVFAAPMAVFVYNLSVPSVLSNLPPILRRPNKKQLMLASLFLLSDAALFFLVYASRTIDTLPSPWQHHGPVFFLLYAAATAILFLTMRQTRSGVTHVLFTIPHLFLTYAIAAIMYPIGFGYDGFIHRAAETWINANGFIAPKTPFYIGQYSMVVWLHQLTGVSIQTIDVFAIPLLASIALPASIVYALRRAWQIPSRYATALVWMAPAIPFLSFHLTTPHNAVLLLTAVIVFAMLAHWHGALPPAIPLLLAAAAVATHPLAGIPVLLFALAGVIRPMGRIGPILTAIAIALAVPGMFAAYLFFTRNTLPALVNPFAKISSFFELFQTPYWYRKKAPLRFELLYAWARALPPIIGLIGLLGLMRQKGSSLVLAAVLGLWIDAWLLRSWIVFPDLSWAEQGDYPLRLLKMSMLFLLPLSMWGVYALWRWVRRIGSIRPIGPILTLLATASAAFFLTISLYLSYPQRNPKVQFPGYNVTAHDFNAVKWIHEREGEHYDYIVLSNPLPAAAALETYSFAKYHETREGPVFYYSIPSGGLLYAKYLDMVYRGQKRETMNDAMRLTDVPRAYFVLNDYWADAKKIADGAKKTADEWGEIDGGNVWVFMYNR